MNDSFQCIRDLLEQILLKKTKIIIRIIFCFFFTLLEVFKFHKRINIIILNFARRNNFKILLKTLKIHPKLPFF